MSTLKKILIPVAVGVTLLALIGLLGSGLVVFREASAVHPALGWVVVALMLAGVGLLIVYPVVKLLRLPSALVRPDETDGPKWKRYLERYAARLLRNRLVKEEYAGAPALRSALDGSKSGGGSDALEAEIKQVLGFLDGKARTAVAKHAAAVFAATAVSQSGRLDTAIVFSAQLRLVKEVAEIYFQRPHPRELWALYLNVGAAGFIAGEIQDSEILAVLGAPVSASLSGLVPLGGTDPLVSLLVNSLLDGSANALLTLRIGVLASRYCGIRVERNRRDAARSASVEAARLLAGVVAQGAHRVAAATRNAMLRPAFKGTQRAAQGVASVGTSLIGGVVKLAEKAGAAAWGATRKAASPATSVLKETLRFWEHVEETVAPEGGQEETRGEP